MKIKEPQKSAAGLKAVFYSMRMALKSMSPLKIWRVLIPLNQKDGTDCPGCAWPDPDHRSNLGEFCENGVKAIAEEATDRKIHTSFFFKHSITSLRNQSDYWLGQQGRLIAPLVKRKGDINYSSISWDEAFDLIACHLNQRKTPDDAIFYTSGRTSNEAAFLYQLFIRIFGTNNLPDCSNLCHESSGVALNHTLGIGKGTVKLEDFYHAELILIFGQNPGTNHPRMLSALEKAKKQGAKVVVINPLKEAGFLRFNNPQKVSGILGRGTDLADLYLQIKINEDVALLKILLLRLLEEEEKSSGVLDQDFIAQKTEGFEKFVAEIKTHDFQSLVHRTGLEVSQIEILVDWLSKKDKIIVCWAMGLTQHVNAVDNIQEIVNLLLLKGSIGKKGAGTCPVRGHSNVQGDRSMGIWDKPSKQFLDTLASTFGFEPPRKHGVDVVQAIKMMYEEPGKYFMSLGGNFLSAAPDTNYTKKALEQTQLSVHISTKLNRSHLYPGQIGLILPCLARTDVIIEKSGPQKLTVENSMGTVHATKGFDKSHTNSLLSEPHIISQIASRTIGNNIVNWQALIDDYDRIRTLISKAIIGFESFNKKLREASIFDLPNGPRNQQFTNDIGKARFTINVLPNYQLHPDELLMMSIRSHDQFNTTIYGIDDRYRGIFGTRKIILMNKADIQRNDLDTARSVTLYNSYGNKRREVSGLKIVTYDIPKGCIATYFPECNVLIPLELKARKSNTPASKSIKVRILQ